MGKVTSIDKAKIEEWAEAGLSIGRIASKLSHLHPSTVRYHAIQLGVYAPPPVKDRPSHTRNGRTVRPIGRKESGEIVAFRESGLNYVEIGRRTGRRPHVVRQHLYAMAARQEGAS